MISVVISTYNRAGMLEGCLNSLIKQAASRDDFEVVVVNNNCTDATSAVVAKALKGGLPVREVFEKRQGLSVARNAGAAAANGSILAFLDDDAVASEQWISSLAEAFNYSPTITLVSGPVVPKFCCEQLPSWLTGDILLGFYALRRAKHPGLMFSESLEDLPYGCNFVIRKSAFFSLGMFDEQLGRVGRKQTGGEDLLLALKVRAAGGRICFHASAAIEHWNSSDKVALSYVESNSISSIHSLYRCLPYLSKSEVSYFLYRASQGREKSLQIEISANPSREDLEQRVFFLRSIAASEYYDELERQLSSSQSCFQHSIELHKMGLDACDLALLAHENEVSWSEDRQCGHELIGLIAERLELRGKRILDLSPARGGVLAAAKLHGVESAVGMVSSLEQSGQLGHVRHLCGISIETIESSEFAKNQKHHKYDVVIDRTPRRLQQVVRLFSDLHYRTSGNNFFVLVENPRGILTQRLARLYGVAKRRFFAAKNLFGSESEDFSVNAIIEEWLAAPTFEFFQDQLEALGLSCNELAASDRDLVEICPVMNALGGSGFSAERVGEVTSDFTAMESALPGSYSRVQFCRNYVSPYWLVHVFREREVLLSERTGLVV